MKFLEFKVSIISHSISHFAISNFLLFIKFRRIQETLFRIPLFNIPPKNLLPTCVWEEEEKKKKTKRTLQEGFKKEKKEKKTLFATLRSPPSPNDKRRSNTPAYRSRLTNKTSQEGREVGFTARVVTFPRASNIFPPGPVVRSPPPHEEKSSIRKVIHAFTPSPLPPSPPAPRARKAHVENGDFLRIFVHAVFFFPPRRSRGVQ